MKNIKYICICVYLPVMCVGSQRGQKGVLHPLELEFHADVSCIMRVLGAELLSSGRAAVLLTAIHPAPSLTPSSSLLYIGNIQTIQSDPLPHFEVLNSLNTAKR